MPSYFSADGLTLQYTDQGAGVPVIALAGLTRNGSDFNHIAPHLSGTRLICPDYRGRGKSDWADWRSYTIPQEAQDILRLMDHLGLEKAAILGTSRGGLIGMVLAAIALDRLIGVALNDIGPVIDPAGLGVIKSIIGVQPRQKTYDAAAIARAALWTQFTDVPLSRWRAEVEQHYEQTADGLILRYDPSLREAFLQAESLPPIDLWPFFDALAGLPVALIRGMNSDLLTLGTADEMARRHPGLIRAEVPGRGHVPFLDEPEAVVALTQWIQALT